MTDVQIGDHAEKVKGYPFAGTVRAVFTTKNGDLRYVVDHDDTGLLHIFSGSQLAFTPREATPAKKDMLPTPPAGCFWRVGRYAPDYYGDITDVYVDLMRPRRFAFLAPDRIARQDTGLANPEPHDIADAAAKLLRDLRVRKTTSALLGDYPPKELA